ncbi:hypothetical protein BBBOND_0308450 [Babesia bigemina]|uniref:Uncharacterized protein n=1 Tax=Babesia bigemina TaxID=5866 RepID=A0A061D8C3_BABBI|nr:hypothetical protein BBBOND_0308450 [Babesia bigemina]CDR96941.1 hypothetical protein BBBOND_0308450 [Babesia bigemina]|eukprot:XP_012769127.1 hypothetical protein BBBOND_0308450 [Babesia bigemina]
MDEDVQRIINEITEGVTDKTYLIEEDAKTLTKKSEELDDLIRSTKEKLGSLVQKTLNEVVILDRAVKDCLNQVKGGLLMAFGEYVKKNLLSTIKGQIIQITKTTGLEGVRQRLVEEYSGHFKNDFKQVVIGWIEEILSDNMVVKDYFGQYVKMNKGLNVKFKEEYIDTEHDSIKVGETEYVANAIVNHLKTSVGITMAEAKVSRDDKDKIHTNIKAVEDCITAFVATLDEKIKEKNSIFLDSSALVIGLANAINTSVVRITHKDISANFLRSAVAAILAALSGKANQVLSELEAFAGIEASEIAKVDAALGVAESLNENLRRATNSKTKEAGATGFYNVDEHVDTILDAEIGESDPGDGKVKLEGVLSFARYRRSITLDAKLKSNPTGTKEEGQLPESIGAIKEEAAGIFIGHITSGLTALSDKIKQDLDTITRAITASANVVKDNLLKFRDDKIGNAAKYTAIKPNTLQKIHENFEELRDPVAKALDGATDLLDKFLAGADKHYTQIISDHVKKDIQKATNKLTTHARKRYVESIKFLLTEFARKVRTELRDLPREIDADLKIGFKGFMKDFHVPLTNDLSSDDYTVHKLSYAFKLCFGPWQMLLEREIDRVDKEERKRKNRTPAVSEVTYTKRLKSVFGALDEVLMHFTGKNGYDRDTHGKLDNLEAAIVGLKPQDFAKQNTGILDSIAAQSLLAAARVGRLAKITYLQP